MGIRYGRPAGYDNGIALPSLYSEKRYMPRREHGKETRGREFVADREADEVHVPQRYPGLESVERKVQFGEKCLEVRRGGEYALAPNAGYAIESVIKYPYRVVGHPNLVEIREAQRDGEKALSCFPNRTELAAEISSGFLDVEEPSTDIMEWPDPSRSVRRDT
jgi:hypothetical protein